MNEMVDNLKLIADKTRLRILLLVDEKELCVCQLMALLGVSQSLLSKNLSLLHRTGFLDARREGKLVFYKINPYIDKNKLFLIKFLKDMLMDEKTFRSDIESLKECTEYQKQTGKCGLEAYKEFMKRKKEAEGN
ncbi:MAG: metalloregulator ArsR/SmtB family transcription factor [Thermodesulfovibrionales bacterium]|nr:metalloregulator ArsR/SmtB family transcription factor [Thermodesulfovibrionales bacterium]